MKFRLIVLLGALMLLVALESGAATVQLPRTGQTSCYSNLGAEIPCAGTGQDGDKLAGKPWPNPRFTDNNDGTVTDNLTDLVWLKNASCPVDADTLLSVKLTWSESLAWSNSLASGACDLSDGSVAGDWRLPNRRELLSLLDRQEASPALPATKPFVNVKSSLYAGDGYAYWTSSTLSTVSWWDKKAYGVVFDDGYLGPGDKTGKLFVWPVRDRVNGTARLAKTGQLGCWDSAGNNMICSGSGQDGDKRKGVDIPLQRFVNNGDGTVTDLLTGLIWLQNANCTDAAGGIVKNSSLFNYSPPGSLYWPHALTWSNALSPGICGLADDSIAGDWRLPNITELESLTDIGYRNPVIAPGYFSNLMQYSAYWSSTSDPRGLGRIAWSMDMSDGILLQQGTQADPNGSYLTYVLPVRGGQFGDAVSSVLPATHDFGSVAVGGSAEQLVTISNNGTASRMHVSSMVLSGTGAWQFSLNFGNGAGGTCGRPTPVIAPGASCTVAVRYVPVAGDAVSANLRISTSDVAAPNTDIALSGTPLYNGACGTAHGGTFIAAPQTNLCAVGTAANVSGSGPWTWSCAGGGGGTDATCAADIKRYSVAFNAGANGTLTGATSQTIAYGGSTTSVAASPNPHYHFLNWSGSLASLANPLTISPVTADLSVTAIFAIDSYAVKFVAAGNGAISGNSSQTVNYGANAASVMASPVYGNHFVNWTEGTTVIGTEPTLSAGVITATHTYTANFAVNTYDVTFTADGNGTLTGATSQTLNHGGSAATVTAVPATNYHFVNWTEGATVVSASAALTMSNITASHTYKANFALDTYTVTFAAAANGTLSGNSSQKVNVGANATTVTAVPAKGYHFVNWTEGSAIIETNAPLTISNVTAAHDYKANFAIDSFALSFSSAGNGTLSGPTAQTVNYGGSIATVTAVPDSNYHFVNWTEGATVASVNAALTVGNITAAHNYTANFALNIYTIKITSAGNGTLSGSTTQAVTVGSDITPVIAVPATGYHFVNWTEGTTVISNSIALTVTGVSAAHSYTANFAINTYTADYSSGGNGSLTGNVSQSINYGGNTTTVTAVPAANYHFVNWTEGATPVGTDPALTVTNVTATHNYLANFAINTYSVTFTSAGNGTISGTTNQIVDHGASTASVTAVPAAGYNFVSWREGTNVVSTSALVTLSKVTSAHNLTANFAVGPVNGACGTSNGRNLTTAPDNNLCAAGIASLLTGTGPWSWKCSGTNGGTNADCSADIQRYTVIPSSAAGSSITPITPQAVTYGGTVKFTVTPAEGYGLLVSGCGGTLNGNSYTTGAVTGDCSVSVVAVARNAHGIDSVQPSINDALKAMFAYSGKSVLSPADKIRYDVAPLGSNGEPVGNGVIDVADIILILRRTVGIGAW